jgi:cell wall-associated NlpC family hydrolase
MKLHALRITLYVVVVSLASFLLPPVAVATPTNAKIEAARREATSARAALDELAADLEERSEEYSAVEQELAMTRQRITVSEEELEAAEAELARAENKLNERARSIYRKGGVDVMSVMLGVTGFRDFVTRLELLRRVNANDAALVAAVKSAKQQAEKTRQSLENRRSEQVVLLRRADEKKQQVQTALESQRSYLAKIDGTLKRLIAEERARQERIAKERAAAEAARVAAQARAAAEAARQRASTDSSSSDKDNGGSSAGEGGSVVGPLPAPHARVLALARTFVGSTPYVWGGTTPAGFDCSGLTMYCYREVGINIPRTSRQQYNYGVRIPADRLDLLQPGDLVFFGRDADPGRIHHVGIYAGNGDYVHAPQAGEPVTESSLFGRIASRGDYVGGVRPR